MNGDENEESKQENDSELTKDVKGSIIKKGPGSVSSSLYRPQKKKKKPKRSRFSSLRSFSRSSKEMGDTINGNEPPPESIPDSVLKRINEDVHLKSHRSVSVDHSSQSTDVQRATTLPTVPLDEEEEEHEAKTRPVSKSSGKKNRWSTMRTAASRIIKENSSKSDENSKHFPSTAGHHTDESSPFPGITHHQDAPNNPFPGINHHQPITAAASLPSRRVQPNLGGVAKSLRQLRESIHLPGTSSKQSRKKYKNLASYAIEKQGSVCGMDKLKLGPLLASKHPIRLEYSSAECKLTDANFVCEFPDNIKEIDFSGNLLHEFPSVSHLKTLKRLFLGNNVFESFALDNVENLELLSLENNKIAHFPVLANCHSLLNLDLRGNKLQDGYSEISRLKNLVVLDISRCMLQMGKEDFEEKILVELKKLEKLEYLCVGDNPISTQFPELKYIIIDELPTLQYFDYQQITQEIRSVAPLVREKGIEALRQSARANKEEKRLQAEQRGSFYSSEKIAAKSQKVKVIPDYTKNVPPAVLSLIFSYLPSESLKSCWLVRKSWHKPAAELFRTRWMRILQDYNIILGSEYYKNLFAPFMDDIKATNLLARIKHRITPISYFDEEHFCREKLVLLLVNKETNANGRWVTLYEQLAYRYCENLYQPEAKFSFKHLRYAVFEIHHGESVASGIDMLLHVAGAKRICSVGNSATISFPSWLEQLQTSLVNSFESIRTIE